MRGGSTSNGISLAWSEDYGRTWQPIAAPAAHSATGLEPTRHADGIPIIISADGAVFVVMTPIPQLSRDHGKSWVSLDLPPSAHVIADRQDPQRLYAVSFLTATLWSSEDSGATFHPIGGKGLPRILSADEPGNPEIPAPLLAVPGRAGDLWLISQGRLFHSLDGGRSFRAVTNDLSIARLGFGKPARERDYPMLYAIASRGDLRAIWRSGDGGSNWTRINDPHHEYGRRFRCIAGDMRIRGRVYVGTDGRGIVYGDSAAGPDR